MNKKFRKINLEGIDHDDHLAKLIAISEEMVETEQIPAVKRSKKAISEVACTRTNAYIKYTPETTVWIRTPETHGEARVIWVKPSYITPGMLIVRCFTRVEMFELEVSGNWPFILKLKWP